MLKHLNTIKDTAERLSVTPTFVKGLIRSGALDSIIVGKRLFVTDAEIDKFLAGLRHGQRVAARFDPHFEPVGFADAEYR